MLASCLEDKSVDQKKSNFELFTLLLVVFYFIVRIWNIVSSVKPRIRMQIEFHDRFEKIEDHTEHRVGRCRFLTSFQILHGIH